MTTMTKKTSSKMIRFPQGTMTEIDWVLNHADRVEKYTQNWQDMYSKKKFNSLDGDRQKTYVEDLKRKSAQPRYRAWSGDTFYDISESSYSAYNSKNAAVITAFKTLARTGKSVTVGSVTVGQETANVVLSFYNKLSAKDKKKFASIKSLEKIVDLAFSGKTVIAEGPSVTGTWEDIVDSYAKAVLSSGLADAVDNAKSKGLISRTPWGGGDDVMDFMPAVDATFRSNVASFLSKIGKDKVVTDCDLFIEDTGENASTYGHYLAMQQMGHGVGLEDYGYTTTLPDVTTEVYGESYSPAEETEDEDGNEGDPSSFVEEDITLTIDGTFFFSISYSDFLH